MTVFDHIDLRVSDVEKCRPFYDAFLRAYGFRGKREENGAMLYYRIDNGQVGEVVVLSAEPGHQPTETCLAFRAASREDVDRIAQIARDAGAVGYEPPAECPEYTATYYAAFFRDPDGNRLEVVCR